MNTVSAPLFTCKIYGLLDPRDGCLRYIGKTIKTLEHRLKNHLRYRPDDLCHRSSWISSLKRDGLIPKIVMLEECAAEEADDMERAWIAGIRAVGAVLVNGTWGGEGGGVTPEARLKISLKNKGRKRSQEFCERQSRALKGRKLSAECRRKIALAGIGRKPTQETLAKLRGRTLPDWHRQKLAEASRNRVITTELRQKMSLAQLGKRYSAEHKERLSRNNHRSMAVVCVETGQIYRSCAYASRCLGLCKPLISQAIRDRSHRAGGFTWRYATQEEIARATSN